MRPALRRVAIAAALCLTAIARGSGPGDVGDVSFPNSGSPAAQEAFLHGLAQLHNFEYESAAEDFRKAAAMDPNFAMAIWGEAMTHNHPIWMEQDLPAAREALGRLGPTPDARLAKAPTEREKDYLRAVEILYGEGTKEDRDFRYADAMRDLHEKYPEDPDAAAFCALSLLGTAHNGRDIPTYMRAAAIVEDVFCRHPNHPGAAHYLIHSTDDPVHAPLGLEAARAYSKIAPNAAHAQHMTSHIFLALGMWDDVVKANETAVAVVNREREKKGKSKSFCGHYAFWLEYGYLQQGRFQEAAQILDSCRAQASEDAPHPHAAETLDPDHSAVGSFVEMRSRYLLDTEDWSGTEAHTSVESGGALAPKFGEVFANGYAAAKRGDLKTAREAISQLEEIAGRLGPLYEKKGYGPDQWVRKIPGVQIDQLRAVVLQAEDKPAEAVTLLRKTAIVEAGLPAAFGPPVVSKPTDELLGEMLLDMHQPAEARRAFEAALARAPRRTASLLGLLLAEQAMGDREAAARTEQTLREIWHSTDRVPAKLR